MAGRERPRLTRTLTSGAVVVLRWLPLPETKKPRRCLPSLQRDDSPPKRGCAASTERAAFSRCQQPTKLSHFTSFTLSSSRPPSLCPLLRVASVYSCLLLFCFCFFSFFVFSSPSALLPPSFLRSVLSEPSYSYHLCHPACHQPSRSQKRAWNRSLGIFTFTCFPHLASGTHPRGLSTLQLLDGLLCCPRLPCYALAAASQLQIQPRGTFRASVCSSIKCCWVPAFCRHHRHGPICK